MKGMLSPRPLQAIVGLRSVQTATGAEQPSRPISLITVNVRRFNNLHSGVVPVRKRSQFATNNAAICVD
jgi:hypothetical protein